MKFTSSATACRSAALACSRSGGSPQMPSPVIRMAPNPSRFTVRSPPTPTVPAAFALGGALMEHLPVSQSQLPSAACRTADLPPGAGALRVAESISGRRRDLAEPAAPEMRRDLDRHALWTYPDVGCGCPAP